MRESIKKLAKHRQHEFLRSPEHAGLAYEVWCPLRPEEGDPRTKDEQAQELNDWIEWVEGTRISTDYKHFYNSWRESFRQTSSIAVEGTLASRLLLGHGNHSPTEVGLTLHHTWGVPMIPGSALKGLLAQYLQANYGPEKVAGHPLEARGEDAERALWQGVGWNGRQIEEGPGAAYRLLFGAPPAKSDDDFTPKEAANLPDSVRKWLDESVENGSDAVADADGWAAWLVGERQGLVTFHDALLIPDDARPNAAFLEHDVLTVHQREYYNAQGGKAVPNDYDAPNPVSFLTVKPGLKFLIALSGPEAWTKLALEELQKALNEWGVGGKTSSSYGRFKEKFSWVVRPPEKAVQNSPVLEEFEAWLKSVTEMLEAKTLTNNVVMDELEARWIKQLRSLSPSEREQARRLCKESLSSKKTRERRDQLLSTLL